MARHRRNDRRPAGSTRLRSRARRRSAAILPDRQCPQLRADVLRRRDRVHVGVRVNNILSWIVWLPIAAAVILAFFPRNAVTAIKSLGLGASIVTFGLSFVVVQLFQDSVATFQFVESHTWIPQWGIRYALGVDGISIWLVMLTTLLTPVVFLSSWNAIHKHPKDYVIAFLIM